MADFPKEGLAFLRELTEHNSSEWFRANKARFERDVKRPVHSLVEAINARLEGFAPRYQAAPAKALGRMNRDVRFSKDKLPYRTDLFCVFPCDGAKKADVSGFYFKLGLDGVELGGGVYMPGKPQLDGLRQGFAERHRELHGILRDPAFRAAFGEVQGERYARVPKPWDREHPAADLLRMKQIYAQARLGRAALNRAGLADAVADRFRVMTPFVRFLDELLEPLR